MIIKSIGRHLIYSMYALSAILVLEPFLSPASMETRQLIIIIIIM